MDGTCTCCVVTIYSQVVIQHYVLFYIVDAPVLMGLSLVEVPYCFWYMNGVNAPYLGVLTHVSRPQSNVSCNGDMGHRTGL